MKSVTVLKFFILTHYKELLTGYETVWIQHGRLCVTYISKQDSARRRCYFFIVVLLPVTSTDPPWNDKQVQPKTVYHFIYLNRFKGWSSWKEKWCLCVFLCLWKDDAKHQMFCYWHHYKCVCMFCLYVFSVFLCTCRLLMIDNIYFLAWYWRRSPVVSGTLGITHIDQETVKWWQIRNRKSSYRHLLTPTLDEPANHGSRK